LVLYFNKFRQRRKKYGKRRCDDEVWKLGISDRNSNRIARWSIPSFTLESTTVAAFFGTETGGAVAWVLAILGAIVGILAFMGKGTITEKEVPAFLMAGIALVVMYGVFQFVTIKPYIGSLLAGISMSLAIFVAPAVGILSIKAIWDIGKEV